MFRSACLVMVLAAAPAFAGKPINWTALREVSRPGPVSVDVKDRGIFRVPTGYRYIGPDKLADFHEYVGDAPAPDEFAAILPEDGGWIAFLALPEVDPLKNLNAADLATDAAKAVLFEWHEKFLADATPKRVALGLPPLKPTGWTHKPAWDAEKKRLTMGVRVAEDRERAEPSKDVLYYQTVLYGPDNRFLTVRAVTSVGNWDKPVEEMKKLVGEFAFPKGDADADAQSAVVHYGKIGGAGLVGVLVAFFGARALLGGSSKRRPSPTQSRPTARKFGSPR